MDTQFVKFETYCKSCLYYHLPEAFDPCNDCLAAGGKEESAIPIGYKKWDKRSKRPKAPADWKDKISDPLKELIDGKGGH